MIEFFIGLLFVIVFIPMFCALCMLIMEEGTKRTIKLLVIPFGFIIILKEKYNKMEK